MATFLATANPAGLIVSGGMKAYGEASGSATVEGRAKSTAKEIADVLKKRFQDQGWINCGCAAVRRIHERRAMNTALSAAIIFGCLMAAVLIGTWIRRLLPAHHLNADTKDTVKLAMGLIATMSALLLGLLISSAKGSYDTVRSEVIQMAAKVAFLDRVLGLYGPDTAPLRARFHTAVEDAIRQMWSQSGGTPAPNVHAGDVLYIAIQSLAPQDDTQRSLKAQAASLAVDLAQLRTLLHAQALASISRPMLVVVVSWLVIIFFSFSLLAPPNATANLALIVSALSVAGAIFLILELDRPFGGLIRVSSDPMLHALSQLAP